MSSSLSNTHGLDRKAIKRPDGFLAALSRGFGTLTSHLQTVVAALVGFLVIGFMIAFFMNRSSVRSEAARNALYLADKAMMEEFKSIIHGELKPEAVEKISFQKMDVEAQFPVTVQKLKEVEQKFSGTRSAFDATLKLGNLYHNHGDYTHSVSWYQKAVSVAPSSFEKSLAFSSLGYTYENLSQFNEAIDAYQRGNGLGQSHIKGDFLLGIARCYEALHDSAKARSTYDQILTELPNTEFSKSAERYKAQIQ